MALGFVSVFAIKLLSMLWAESPREALDNAFNHLHFLLWPALLPFLRKAQVSPLKSEPWIVVSMGLLMVWYLCAIYWFPSSEQAACFAGGTGNCGLLGLTIAFFLFWLFVALTRPAASSRRRVWLALGMVAGWIAFVGTQRRTEMLGLAVALLGVIAWRAAGQITKRRVAYMSLVMALLFTASFQVLEPRFSMVEGEVAEYMQGGEARTRSVQTSVGGRLEMYRVAFDAMAERPWLGWGAGIKPRDLPQFAHDPNNTLPYRNFHNQYIQWALELGVIGLALLAVVGGFLLRAMVLSPRFVQRSEMVVLLLGLWFLYAWKALSFTSIGYGLFNAFFVFFTAWFWVDMTGREPMPVSNV